MKEITKEQFIEILLDHTVTSVEDIAVFQAIYSFDNHKTYASQVGRLLGGKGKMPGSKVNLQIGRLGKRIAKKYDLVFTVRSNGKLKFWDIFFKGWDEGGLFAWQLKPNLTEALIETGLTGEIQYSEEIPTEYEHKLFEGAKRSVTINSFERNSQARRLCILHWGVTCSVCEFDFEKEYGEVGKNFIHVHHLTPISDIGQSYEIDPVKDLRPVCPNCHSMLHREKDTLTIDELKEYYCKANGRQRNYQ